MKKTLFEQIFEKYGIVISKKLWPQQIEELEAAFEAMEKKEKVELYDSFTHLAFDLIACDLKWQKRKEMEENEK